VVIHGNSYLLVLLLAEVAAARSRAFESARLAGSMPRRGSRDANLRREPTKRGRCDNRADGMTSTPPAKHILCAFLLCGLSGCGYHTAGSASHLPPTVRTIAVPTFTTRAQQFHTEFAFTKAVVAELNSRTKYRVLNQDDDADATLHGTILSEIASPLTYDSQSGQTSSYLITITARVVLNAHDGRVLYQNNSLLFREQYQSTQDVTSFIQEDGPAVQRVARDFAQTVVANILDSF
jgi:outer membrane lipopolysaccharide assembly protein LptE/RlpB